MSSLNACFTWLSYLVHSCTNTILLHLFTQSVCYGCLKDVSKVKGLIDVSQAQEKGFLKIQGLLMSKFLFKVM